ncbi:MAG: hypothetical protein K1X66_00700 [Verrucomicrobiae bacterium]|nr:hypothetical protein [Verrucomicrobiae bacterium]
MKTKFSIFILSLLIIQKSFATTDPVRDFLHSPHPSFLSTHPSNFFKSDRLLRIDIDLNNDGKKEMLLSLSRDIDGHQGNIWKIHQKINGEFEYVGEMTFHENQFYIGHIDELGQYGLVCFGPGGGGTGNFNAYLFDGEKITETIFARIERNEKTYKFEDNVLLKKRELFKKYLDDKMVRGKDIIQEIPIQELAKRYGLRVDPLTYEQALDEEMARESKTNAQPIPSSK